MPIQKQEISDLIWWHYNGVFREDISDYLRDLFLDTAWELSNLRRYGQPKIEKIPQTAELLLDISNKLKNELEKSQRAEMSVREGIEALITYGQLVSLMTKIWPAGDERSVKKLAKNYSEKLRSYGLELSDPKRIPEDKINELEKFCLNLISIEHMRADPIPFL